MCQEELDLIRNNTVDFLSFSYYHTKVISAKFDKPQDNPYLERSIWGWQLIQSDLEIL